MILLKHVLWAAVTTVWFGEAVALKKEQGL